MDRIHYTVTKNTLSDAALLFFESSLLQKMALRTLWLLAFMMVVLTFLKIFVLGVAATDVFRLLVACAWIFYWRPLLRYVSRYFIQRRIGATQHYSVALHLDCLDWHTGGPTARLPWRGMRRVLAPTNGYLFPAGSIRYLWLPSQALTNEQSTFLISALRAHNIPIVPINRQCGD
ncbi:MAG: hypothetical protein V4490_01435 [Pseudomonadota bacterium]